MTIRRLLVMGNDGRAQQVQAGDSPAYPAGASTSLAQPGGVVYAWLGNNATVGTSETNLFSVNLAGHVLNTNLDHLRFEFGVTLANSTYTKQLRVYFAGQLLLDTGALTANSGGAIVVRGTILRTGSGTAAYAVEATLTGPSVTGMAAAGTLSGLSLTNTCALTCSGQAGGTGATDRQLVGQTGWVDFMPSVSP